MAERYQPRGVVSFQTVDEQGRAGDVEQARHLTLLPPEGVEAGLSWVGLTSCGRYGRLTMLEEVHVQDIVDMCGPCLLKEHGRYGISPP